MAKAKQVIAFGAPVSVSAAEADGGPATFETTFYTGGKLEIEGWDLPVVVDLAGLKTGNVLVANLDHDRTKRVGNFAVDNDGQKLVARGKATAKTAARDEVVGSALEGYQWQSSLEVQPSKIETVKANATVTINGQTFTGPMYVTRTGTLKGFAFVSHGADDNTTVSIAASAAKGNAMKAEVKAWISQMLPSLDVDALSADEVANLERQYAGSNPRPISKPKLDDALSAKKADIERQDAITEIALKACDSRPYDIEAIKRLAQDAVDAKWSVEKFRLELLEATMPAAPSIWTREPKDRGLNNKILEAAVLQAGRYPDELLEKRYDDQTLQAAHDRYKGRIGLKQLMLVAAKANGFDDHSMDVNIETQRAAFRMHGYGSHAQQIRAAGFSTIDIANIVSNVANLQIMRGWNAVCQTCLRISKIQNVSDFKQVTTVSLTDSVRFEQVASDGQIRHGTLDELTYTNQADTYAKMLAITRKDIINDNLGALNDVPAKLGNGAMKLLNHIFWTEFLSGVSSSFFASGNSNINTGVADMTVGGLDATETIFNNQTNPDGTPLAAMAQIILVPTALKNKALTLMGSMSSGVAITSYATATGEMNPFAGRFRVESSPYISNSSYTGYTAAGWWMLANPNEIPVIAIAALNGRVEPTVETSDADFNTLGVQMRGYSDVGVNLQEYRGGVYADGGSS